MSANVAKIVAVLGSSGSGKSTYIKREVAKGHQRLMIWDPLSEYGGVAKQVSAMGVIDAIQKKRFRLSFVPSPFTELRARQFDWICRAALAAGNLTLVVEELRFVTTPSRAPMGWAQVCLQGRHAGLTVYGASQRPASIDKDFLGNCTAIRTGRLAYPEDRRAVSKATGISEAEIQALQPLDWIAQDMATGEKTSGRLRF